MNAGTGDVILDLTTGGLSDADPSIDLTGDSVRVVVRDTTLEH